MAGGRVNEEGEWGVIVKRGGGVGCQSDSVRDKKG